MPAEFPESADAPLAPDAAASPDAAAPPFASSHLTPVIEELVECHGEEARARATTGVRQVAARWREVDGGPEAFTRLCSWGYNPYTWHTNRDTYEKVVFEEIRSNAALVAMLVYLASEDPERVSRTEQVLPGNQSWPACQPGQVSGGA